jgi:hypothetical protein
MKRILITIAVFLLFTHAATAQVRQPVDTELPNPATQGDSESNPSVTSVGVYNKAWSGSVWSRVTFGAAGTASSQVWTVQGIASMTPLSTNITQYLGSAVSATNPIAFRPSDGTAFVTFSQDSTEGSSAQTVGPTNMMYFDDTPATVTEGQAKRWRGSNKGDGYMYLRDAAGNERGANVNASGAVITATVDPCSGAKTPVPINVSTATTTELTASLAGASNHYYICSINLITAAANNVALTDDDSDGCGSVTSGLAGGTTAASGWNFGANGGITLGSGMGTVMRTNGTNRVVCLVTSAATQLSGAMMVVIAP